MWPGCGAGAELPITLETYFKESKNGRKKTNSVKS
jgi:hypothetical protein